MTKIKDKAVLITGAASGIGKLMAQESLQRGAKAVYLWDINAEQLSNVCAQLNQMNLGVARGFSLDLSNAEEIYQTADTMHAEGCIPDIVINNAGIVTGKLFWEHKPSDIEKIFQVNSQALMHVALAIMPQLLEKKEAHIVNIASAAGMLANPKMSVYAGSKWAVIGWSESLRLELEGENKPIKITTVTPSYIKTGMFNGVQTHAILPLVEPLVATNKILDGVENNAIFVRMPWAVNLLPFLRGILPTRLFDALVGKWLGVYKSMQHFTGHKKVEKVKAAKQE
ncbi:MAG: SDR family NAD(P)-dependent oxidoreductase [Luteibaculaceae bacterium]